VTDLIKLSGIRGIFGFNLGLFCLDLLSGSGYGVVAIRRQM
jgi:hypothetical protein